MPGADRVSSPIKESEGGHCAQEIHKNQRKNINREEPKQDMVCDFRVPVTSESESGSRINGSTRRLRKEIPTVAIHERDPNHGSQDHEEKKHAEDRYRDVCHCEISKLDL